MRARAPRWTGARPAAARRGSRRRSGRAVGWAPARFRGVFPALALLAHRFPKHPIRKRSCPKPRTRQTRKHFTASLAYTRALSGPKPMNAPLPKPSQVDRARDARRQVHARRGRAFMTACRRRAAADVQTRARRRRGVEHRRLVSGYRGSPLAATTRRCGGEKHLRRTHRVPAGVNEELGATAVWARSSSTLPDRRTTTALFGIWYGKGPGLDRSIDVFKHATWPAREARA